MSLRKVNNSKAYASFWPARFTAMPLNRLIPLNSGKIVEVPEAGHYTFSFSSTCLKNLLPSTRSTKIIIRINFIEKVNKERI